jgi:hypothetical protein
MKEPEIYCDKHDDSSWADINADRWSTQKRFYKVVEHNPRLREWVVMKLHIVSPLMEGVRNTECLSCYDSGYKAIYGLLTILAKTEILRV